MVETGAALFDTALGRCGIAWNRAGISALRLPDTNDDGMRAQLLERQPSAKFVSSPRSWPPFVRDAVRDVVALLAGQACDLSGIVLDFEGVPPFHRLVYDAARSLGPGTSCTYGELATRLGKPGASRAVGQALGRNPFAVIVPCHRVLAAGGKLGGFTATGGTATKQRMLEIEGARAAAAVSSSGTALFNGAGGLGFDPELAVRTLAAGDPKLRRLIERVGPLGLRVTETSTLFGALAESIVYQQLAGKAAATIFGRVCDLFAGGREGLAPRAFLNLTDERLRGAGLSRNKLLSLRDLAERAHGGTLPTLVEAQQLQDEALIERLTEVRGIGRWTVQMLLMFRLGRPDVLPIDDFGVQKGYSLTFGVEQAQARAEITKRAERWRPYRSVACWYLWRAVDLAKQAPELTELSKRRGTGSRAASGRARS